MRIRNWVDDLLDLNKSVKAWLKKQRLIIFQIFSIFILVLGIGAFVALLLLQVSYDKDINILVKNKNNQVEGEFTFVYPQWIYAWQGIDQVDIRFIPDNSLTEALKYKVNLIEEQPALIKLSDAKVMEVSVTPPGRFDGFMVFTTRGVPASIDSVSFRAEIWSDNNPIPMIETIQIGVNHYPPTLPIIASTLGLLSTILSTVGNKFLSKAITKIFGD